MVKKNRLDFLCHSYALHLAFVHHEGRRVVYAAAQERGDFAITTHTRYGK